MSEKFAKIVTYTALAAGIAAGILLTVAGGFMDGWGGVAAMLAGLAVFIVILYLYNRKYR